MTNCIDCCAPGQLLGIRTDEVRLAQCMSCGLVYRTNWSSAFDEELYGYYSARVEGASEAEVYRPINLERIGDLLRELETSVSGRRLLDVGCGEGVFVRASLDEGWEASGIDLAAGAIAIAQRFGLPCRQLDFFDSSLDGDRFDLIVMSEFIEHVPTPTRFLERAADLLAPGGLVYVTTPNYSSLGRRILGPDWRQIHPEHLSYFTPRTLERAASHAGLQVASIETRNLSMATIRKLLLRPVPRAETPEHRADEQACRAHIQGSRALSAVRRVIDGVLDLTNLGESIKATLRRAGAGNRA